jgi:hypothetical protein
MRPNQKPLELRSCVWAIVLVFVLIENQDRSIRWGRVELRNTIFSEATRYALSESLDSPVRIWLQNGFVYAC